MLIMGRNNYHCSYSKMCKGKNLTAFEWGMIVGIFEMANVLHFSYATVSQLFRVADEPKKLLAMKATVIWNCRWMKEKTAGINYPQQ